MFCKSCGKEINNDAVVCPFCGCQQQPYQQFQPYQQPDVVDVGLVVLSVIIPIAGIILGAVNLSNGKQKSGKACLIASVVTISIMLIVGIVGATFAALLWWE